MPWVRDILLSMWVQAVSGQEGVMFRMENHSWELTLSLIDTQTHPHCTPIPTHNWKRLNDSNDIDIWHCYRILDFTEYFHIHGLRIKKVRVSGDDQEELWREWIEKNRDYIEILWGKKCLWVGTSEKSKHCREWQLTEKTWSLIIRLFKQWLLFSVSAFLHLERRCSRLESANMSQSRLQS